MGDRQGAREREACRRDRADELAAARQPTRRVRSGVWRPRPHQPPRRADYEGDSRGCATRRAHLFHDRESYRGSHDAQRRQRFAWRNAMKRPALGLIAAAFAVVSAIPSASEQASQAVVEKGRAPVSNQLLQIKLPRPAEADLSNGLHVMVLEDRRAPQVNIQLIVRGAGGYFDPPDRLGLAQFTAANMREGTATKSSATIAEQLERLAATLTVTATMSDEDATVSATALTEHVDAVLDLMAEVVTGPVFPEQELARYKAQTRAQLVQQRANPAFLGQERFSSVVAGAHPGGRLAPSLDALEKATR